MSFCCGASLSYRITWGIQSHSIYREAVICTMPLKCAPVYEHQKCVSNRIQQRQTFHSSPWRFQGCQMSQRVRQAVLWNVRILDPAKIRVFRYLWFSPLIWRVLSTPFRPTSSLIWGLQGQEAALGSERWSYFFSTFNTDWAGWLSCWVVSDSWDPVAPQAPLSMGFPREECWSGLPRPSSGDLPSLLAEAH